MGGLVNTVGDLFGQAPNNANFQAQGANVIQPVTQEQAAGALTANNSGLAQQQNLINALQAQNGIQNQSNVYNQLQGVANGTGPNPAQAELNQATGANVANQAALMAGQRGAGANVGLLARQAAQQGAGLQQQAVGQGASLQANQSLNALGQLGGLAGQQVAQQQNAVQGYNQAAQGNTSQLLGALQGYNNANVQNNSNVNSTNQGMANANAQRTAGGIGGLASSIGPSILPFLKSKPKPSDGATVTAGGGDNLSSTIGSLGQLAMFASQGGEVSNAKLAQVPVKDRFPVAKMPPHLRMAAEIYHPHMMSEGGQAQNSQGYDSETAAKLQKGFNHNPISDAVSAIKSVFAPKEPAQSSNMAKGGTVPAMLSPGEKYLTPEQAKETVEKGKNPLKEGKKVPGHAQVHGDSKENDTVPAKLEEGGIVIPRSIIQGKNPAEAAAKFVTEHLSKNGSGDPNADFKEALKKAIASRKVK